MQENCSECSFYAHCLLMGGKQLCNCCVEMDSDEQEFLDYLKYGDGAMLSIEENT
jgi:hypothetical protein